MVADDKPALDILNAAGVDLSSVGNHEFDEGWSDLSAASTPLQLPAYLGANVYNKGTTTVAAPLKEYHVIEKARRQDRRRRRRHPATPRPSWSICTGIAADADLGDPIEAVNKAVAEIENGGLADVIIVSFHEGAAGSRRRGRRAPHSGQAARRRRPRVAAAIFNAHTHYGPLTLTTADGTPVVQAKSYGELLGQVDLSVEADKGLCATPVASIVKSAAVDAANPVVSSIVSIGQTAKDEAGDRARQEVIGTAARSPSPPPVAGSANTRDQESPMSNMVAQMYYDVLGNGNTEFIGIQNPGGTWATSL